MTPQPPRPYSFAPHALIASAGAADLLTEVKGAGYQAEWRVNLSELAASRLSLNPEVIVVALDDAPDPDVLDLILDLADQGDRLVVRFPMAAFETVVDRLGGSNVVLLSDPAPGELTGVLTLIRMEPRHQLHDSGNNTDALRLQLLADQVSRIARTLAEMTEAEPTLGRRGGLRSPTDDFSATPRAIATDAPVTAKAVRAVINERRLRERFLDPDLFGEPGWDMLLDLYAARLEHARVSVSSLCIAAAVPSTTALRWLRTLTQTGLVVRRADPRDKRRVFIEMGEQTGVAMDSYFQALKSE